MSGAADIFERSGGGWHQRLIPEDNNPRDRFGESVAISADGQTAPSSAIWDAEPNGNRAGSAYVFEKAEVTRTPMPTPMNNATGDGTGPGFGLGTAVAGLGTGVYLLRRRFTDTNAD